MFVENHDAAALHVSVENYGAAAVQRNYGDAALEGSAENYVGAALHRSVDS